MGITKLKTKSLIGASLLTAVLCAGCAVNTGDIEQAQNICKEHGGIKYLYAFPEKEVKCNDGIIGASWKDA